jgi:hypothetical protein
MIYTAFQPSQSRARWLQSLWGFKRQLHVIPSYVACRIDGYAVAGLYLPSTYIDDSKGSIQSEGYSQNSHTGT